MHSNKLSQSQQQDQQHEESQIVKTPNSFKNKPKNMQVQNKEKIYIGLIILLVILFIFSIYNKSDERKITDQIDKLNKFRNQVKQLTKQLQQSRQKLKAIVQKKEKNQQAINNLMIKQEPKIFTALHVNPLKRSSDNKGIADVLYKDEETRKQRLAFIQQRIDFVNSKKEFKSVGLVKYNLIADEQRAKEGVAENEADWLRLQKEHKLSSVKKELPMCIISSSYNNNARFRIEANLNSVFLQNYTNFKHVIINDASTDGSGEVYRNYFSFHNIDKAKYAYIENPKRITALQNIYEASLKQCAKDSMIIILDGDDELIGRNTLRLFNWGFQTLKAGVLYSNFYYYLQGQYVRAGYTSAYDDNQRNNNLYRNIPHRISHLRASRAQLFHQLSPKDLQDDKGKFFTIDADIALFFPLMELSCGRAYKIEGEFSLLYNSATGINEYVINPQRQIDTEKIIRSMPKLSCFKEFGDRMSK